MNSRLHLYSVCNVGLFERACLLPTSWVVGRKQKKVGTKSIDETWSLGIRQMVLGYSLLLLNIINPWPWGKLLVTQLALAGIAVLGLLTVIGACQRERNLKENNGMTKSHSLYYLVAILAWLGALAMLVIGWFILTVAQISWEQYDDMLSKHLAVALIPGAVYVLYMGSSLFALGCNRLFDGAERSKRNRARRR